MEAQADPIFIRMAYMDRGKFGPGPVLGKAYFVGKGPFLPHIPDSV